ncbi:MAG: hypothetical protein KGZ97_09615 [Bacteroidetes bacterium]|nr:hypothetical protein [Bacteroidota bacterium]
MWLGAREIPQLNQSLFLGKDYSLDFEASANISASTGFEFSNYDIEYDGRIKPYRFWGRFSSNQFELRLGLQKINFGSASLLRPLMWFDQVDPRDPLQLTDGVWGILGRYYFLNNTNIWLWGLYGNDGPKTWEIGQTSKGTPEFGGRIQTPMPAGEIAVSFHHRNSNTQNLLYLPNVEDISENRIGIDGKWDLIVGLWFEAAVIHKGKDLGIFTNQNIATFGTDYTFGIGNGLYAAFEQLFFSMDKDLLEFANKKYFSAASLSYPLDIFNNLSAMVYYDWSNKNYYNFLNFQHSRDNVSFFIMAFWNPETFNLPQQNEASKLFAGRGMQLMVVYNY